MCIFGEIRVNPYLLPALMSFSGLKQTVSSLTESLAPGIESLHKPHFPALTPSSLPSPSHHPCVSLSLSLSLCFPSDQSLMVVEAALSRVRRTLPSQSRTRRSWAPMMTSRRILMTTAEVGCPTHLLDTCVSSKITLLSLIASVFTDEMR